MCMLSPTVCVRTCFIYLNVKQWSTGIIIVNGLSITLQTYVYIYISKLFPKRPRFFFKINNCVKIDINK